MVERVAQDLDDDEQQEDGDGGGGDRFVLAMAVRMVLVRRPLGRADADQADDVRAASVSEWKPSDRMLIAPLA